MLPQRLLEYATVWLPMLLMLNGCETALSGDFCTLYRPVYTAETDSVETRQEADVNNAVWLELCQHESPSK
ncbi:MAG: hypothetical protein PW788_02690 [Micavibrio sp.]|nr:hypothetical protein [Micavibrio sp.]